MKALSEEAAIQIVHCQILGRDFWVIPSLLGDIFFALVGDTQLILWWLMCMKVLSERMMNQLQRDEGSGGMLMASAW